ncbi:2Fe-2S iron-sulfur cluster-binding protein [Oscillatoria amoena NRMC-F 0135]|nr:molybdopterin-dependent oxidoreductase [Oscillatoria laete-virens]MDL5048181.1 2Fe-2S iron-sulfur cluster-binding protein [Oscillatoria amoena NRMC-F 0135]MDL5053074.1 2Fe-2S iron-sulfur cluster-binding protein [Oscillatoria laete-virens NRMC-F 0139]
MTAAATEPKPLVDLVNVQIDGQWMQFPKGMRLIEAIKEAGKFVPHYCYHPKLSSPGNCRMCLIEAGMPKMGPDRKPIMGADGKPEIGWMPRPMISCANTVAEGMGVRTDSQLVKDCQNGVMELLLINHPLDCPICDQAGECKLQEYSIEYGTGQSRFVENKVKKPKEVELGPRVTLDDERCILCSRCVRFCQEVVKDDVLGFVNRGSYNTLTCHPDKKLDNNYSLNTVDICPVGALTSTDFRFKMRVWFLKETKSICTSCSTGCNTVVSSRENVIYRQVPRENNDVNSSWMCDSGRLNYKFTAENRASGVIMKKHTGRRAPEFQDAITALAADLKQFAPGEVAILASGRMTCEELYLTRKLADDLKATHTDIFPRNQKEDGILMSADRNPNTAGARLTGVVAGEPGAAIARMAAGINDGSIKALLVLGEDALDCGFAEETLARLPLLVTVASRKLRTDVIAHYAFSSLTWAEKRGTMINGKGRIQKINKAIEPLVEAVDDWEIIQGIRVGLGAKAYYDQASLFAEMTAEHQPLQGLTYGKIGDLGVQIL